MQERSGPLGLRSSDVELAGRIDRIGQSRLVLAGSVELMEGFLMLAVELDC